MSRIGTAVVAVVLALSGCGGVEPAEPRPNPQGPPPDGMVLVPGGDYTIGSDGGDPDEGPVHRVRLDPFYLDAREVTNAGFKRFVEATGYRAEGDWQAFARSGRELHPVVSVTWNDATAFAAWAG